jgi:uncharacterized protein YggT (Ycf19 family)
MVYRVRSLLAILVDLFMAVVAFFLGMRVILELFAANAATPFVAWIYRVSGGLMYPFNGLFPNLAISDFGFLDITALVTLFAYAVIGYLILGVIRSVMRNADYVEAPHHGHYV